MTTIIAFTDKAKARIAKILQQQAGQALRIAVAKSGCSGWKYVIETTSEMPAHHISIPLENNTQVYVDENALKFLQGSTLDCVEKGMGLWQWQFDNPQAKSSCGCGESIQF